MPHQFVGFSCTGLRGVLSGMQQWHLLQLADPTLPIGGFAHSGGLEACSMLCQQHKEALR
eukprot:4597277-Amphidinium_carterae.1